MYGQTDRRGTGRILGWNKNTTYTAIKECVEKGLISEKETVLTISFTGTDVSIAFEAPDDLFT